MDFSLTQAQQDLAALTRDILADHVTQERLRAVESGTDHFDRSLWTVLGSAGVLSAALPESAGGSGFDLLEQCSVLVEIGRHVAPVPYLCSVVQAASAIAHFGTPEQRERWLAPSGLVLTAALSEEHNEDPAKPVTRAELVADRWCLTGAKTTVPSGPVADLFLVPASTPDGVKVFLVRPEDEGVRLARQEIVDGDSAAWLELTTVALPRDRELAVSADWLVTRGTVGLCALQLGVAERALELTAEHARTRVQFDRPIGSFQAVSQRLADAYVAVEAIRLTLWQAAWRVVAGLPADSEVATAKFWAAEAGHQVAHTAVHVHGGMGIDLDHPLHRYFVAAKRTEFALGGATAQLRRIGAALAASPA
ncbi:acyl-CoA dehydrogenase family protein [Kutzneria viridogrisea]|uniref:Acyl-CoA dehydrogenase n=2 Tax=Kutzneria TaxID=43356 RepID=W5W7S9_9PSEU|nr:acyl-CoA dehydrogenase family protein [Kutzneria albida]AHH96780.1 acyl-CoA dehydrogenase [Kutzneria albida DSM 43870]MBA8928001.1 acyl-CoA dehydrogenase [Kutzneria viridogrisea]